MNKNLLKLAFVVGLGTIVATGFYFYGKRKQANIAVPQFNVAEKEIAADAVPNGLPVDLPTEFGSKIQQNHEDVTSDGRRQSTRVMTTNKTLPQALKFYNDFFVKLGWEQTVSESRDENTSSSLLKKGDDNLLIIVRNNPVTNEKIVSIALTEAPKK